MLIGGELVESSGGEWLVSVNPATEEPIGRVPLATAEDVERAIAAGEAAWPDCAGLTPLQRSEAMNRFADAIAASICRKAAAVRVTTETQSNEGKPRAKATAIAIWTWHESSCHFRISEGRHAVAQYVTYADGS
jgi:aldehyde dehydrogenase (NAD+)/betaine-aldehyde dehydrogenase